MVVEMTRRRGEIEEWVKRVFYGGERDKYVIYVRWREEGVEELVPIPCNMITDVRRGYIVVGEAMIPFHRVEEIRDTSGRLLFKRKRKNIEK